MEDLSRPSEGRRRPDTKVPFAIRSSHNGILQLVCVVDFAVFSSNVWRLTFISIEEKISIGRVALKVRKIILYASASVYITL